MIKGGGKNLHIGVTNGIVAGLSVPKFIFLGLLAIDEIQRRA
jgi:hypothetical protein